MNARYLIVIPLYNHGTTVGTVVEDVFAVLLRTALPATDADQAGLLPTAPSPGRTVPGSQPGTARPEILVINDGSTDRGGEFVKELQAKYAHEDGQGVLHLLEHDRNLGKGQAIQNAAAWASERGFTHIVTLDADGQHDPRDIPVLLQASAGAPGAIIVGARDFSTENVPGASRFGRSFSGFWMRVQTGLGVSDMQSGFRIYPVSILRGLAFKEKRFAFELEVLVKSAWSGFEIRSVPVRVHYPPPGRRVSHFHKFHDNLRISIMNTKLTIRALLPIPFAQREPDAQGKISVLRPRESIRRLLLRQNTPYKLALSTFTGVLLNMLPLIGLQSILTLMAIGWFKLNRVWTLAVYHAVWPPLIIPVCIEGGYFLRNGKFLSEISWRTLAEQASPSRLLDWILGGMVFGPLCAFACSLLVYLAALKIRAGLRPKGKQSVDPA